MAGISDKAIKTNYAENKYRYNGKELNSKEFSDGAGLEEYDFGFRFQDPQLGVWHSLDPLAEKASSSSPYGYALDNPVSFIDPNGAYIAPAASLINVSNGPNAGFDDNDDFGRSRSGGGGGGGGGGYNGGGGTGGGTASGDGMYLGNGMYQLPGGQIGDISEALNYISMAYPGSITTLTNVTVQNYFTATWGSQATNISAQTNNNSGFDVKFTATSSGNTYTTAYSFDELVSLMAGTGYETSEYGFGGDAMFMGDIGFGFQFPNFEMNHEFTTIQKSKDFFNWGFLKGTAIGGYTKETGEGLFAEFSTFDNGHLASRGVGIHSGNYSASLNFDIDNIGLILDIGIGPWDIIPEFSIKNGFSFGHTYTYESGEMTGVNYSIPLIPFTGTAGQPSYAPQIVP
jgi:RHS repeat-associated protein